MERGSLQDQVTELVLGEDIFLKEEKAAGYCTGKVRHKIEEAVHNLIIILICVPIGERKIKEVLQRKRLFGAEPG